MSYLLPDEALTPELFNERARGSLPDHLAIKLLITRRDRFEGRFTVQPFHMAPNGFLHAGSVVTLADSMCGLACVANLTSEAKGFTTIELKTNFFATAREGNVHAAAIPVHLGRTTHVWDCEVTSEATGKRMALFRCTQMILFP